MSKWSINVLDQCVKDLMQHQPKVHILKLPDIFVNSTESASNLDKIHSDLTEQLFTENLEFIHRHVNDSNQVDTFDVIPSHSISGFLTISQQRSLIKDESDDEGIGDGDDKQSSRKSSTSSQEMKNCFELSFDTINSTDQSLDSSETESNVSEIKLQESEIDSEKESHPGKYFNQQNYLEEPTIPMNERCDSNWKELDFNHRPGLEKEKFSNEIDLVKDPNYVMTKRKKSNDYDSTPADNKKCKLACLSPAPIESEAKVKSPMKTLRLWDKSPSNEEIENEKLEEISQENDSTIDRILTQFELERETIEATIEERNRVNRVIELEKRYNQLLSTIKVDNKRLILDMDNQGEVRVEVSNILAAELKPHQREGIRFLYNSTIESIDRIEHNGSGCILAHCMGLGKTLQAITFVHTLLSNQHTSNHVKTILITVPVNTLKNWTEEFDKWITKKGLKSLKVFEINDEILIGSRLHRLGCWQRDGGVLIIGHNLLGNLLNLQDAKKKVALSDIKLFERYLANPGPDMVIIDEGHLLKSPTNRICKAVVTMKTRRKIILTGTPIQNNLVEYYTVIDIIKPGLLGSKKEFINQFRKPIEDGQKANSTVTEFKLMKQKTTILHKLLSGSIQRFDFDILSLHLKPKSEYVIYIRPSKLIVSMYNFFVDKAQNERKHLTHANYLRLCVNHPAIYHLQEAKEIAKRQNQSVDRKKSQSESDLIDLSSDSESCDLIKDKYESPINPNIIKDDWFKQFVQPDDWNDVQLSGKFFLLFQILSECISIGDKLVVASQSIETLDTIESFLLDCKKINLRNQNLQRDWKLGQNYFRIDGLTPVEDRHSQINNFNDPENRDGQLFLLSTRAGGIGINLIAANRVVIFDVSWNPSDDVQAIYRVFRLGQMKPVFVYRFVTKDTMEEQIFRKQVLKLGMAIRIIDQVQVRRISTTCEPDEFYDTRPKDHYQKSLSNIPEDRLLAKLLQYDDENFILKCTPFDSLLEKKPEDELTEEERQAAWTQYQKGREAEFNESEELRNDQENNVIEIDDNDDPEIMLIESREQGHCTARRVSDKRTAESSMNATTSTVPILEKSNSSVPVTQSNHINTPWVSSSYTIPRVPKPSTETPATNNSSQPNSSSNLIESNVDPSKRNDRPSNNSNQQSLSWSPHFKPFYEQAPNLSTLGQSQLPSSFQTYVPDLRSDGKFFRITESSLGQRNSLPSSIPVLGVNVKNCNIYAGDKSNILTRTNSQHAEVIRVTGATFNNYSQMQTINRQFKPPNWLDVSKVKVGRVIFVREMKNGQYQSVNDTAISFQLMYNMIGKQRYKVDVLKCEENCLAVYVDSHENQAALLKHFDELNESEIFKSDRRMFCSRLLKLHNPVIQFQPAECYIMNTSQLMANLKRWNHWNDQVTMISEKASKGQYKISISVSPMIRDSIEQKNGTISLGEYRVSVIDDFGLVQCISCFHYGHSNCAIPLKCCRFCNKHHYGECNVALFPDQWFCKICKVKGHSAISKNCPVFIHHLVPKLKNIDYKYNHIFLGDDKLCYHRFD